MTDDRNKFQIRLIRWALLLGTFFLYLPVTGHPFITYDDYVYVVNNPHVSAGLTGAGFIWALTSGYASNWHPLTWISHMLDCQIYGPNHPGGHHLTNLLLHLANTLLMFELWRRLTKMIWPSAFVAAFFAWHPLHVESVAWVAERKDVLSAFFFLLTLLAYLRFAETSAVENQKSKNCYGVTLLLFALGLMAKPMIVTLPFVMLLLDFWPLQRISAPKQTGPPALKILLEKIPFLALSFASCVITFLVQKNSGAMKSTMGLTITDRLGAAVLGYMAYLKMAFWPVKLAVFYPFLSNLPRNEITTGVIILVLISVLVIAFIRSRPYLFVGWFWFLGMLTPVIGIVTVGVQAYADRYTYLPLVGIFVALIWGLNELTASRANLRIACGTALAVALAICAMLTHREIGYWKDSFSLFSRASEVTRDNPVLEYNLGLAMEFDGQPVAAAKYFEASIKLTPDVVEAWHFLGLNQASRSNYQGAIESYGQVLRLGGETAMLRFNYGNAFAALGDLTNAAAQFQRSVQLDASFAPAHNNLGAVLFRLDRLDEALFQLETAVTLQPDYAAAQDQLGRVFLKLGRPEQALPCFRAAVASAPTLADAQLQLGLILARQGNLKYALGPLQTAAKLQPTNPLAAFSLGALYDALEKFDLASDNFAQALRLDPHDADTAERLGAALARQGKSADAAAAFRQALSLNPNSINALQGLAWILATSPNAELRNGVEALRLAQHAVELTGRKQTSALAALDAALAESGRFDEAIRVAQETAQLARSMSENEIANQALARIEFYKSGKPWREPAH